MYREILKLKSIRNGPKLEDINLPKMTQKWLIIKHSKIISTSLTIREMQTTTTITQYLTLD